MPRTVRKISHLRIKVSVQLDDLGPGGGGEGEQGAQMGDLVAQTFRKMVQFKLACKNREMLAVATGDACKIEWSWEREGILTILLQQNILQNVSELLEP